VDPQAVDFNESRRAVRVFALEASRR
jgi:hypothetical protein